MAPQPAGRAPIEIACDESGSEGERLTRGETRLFSHASVLTSVAAADECLAELRSRIRSPATEYKATHLLRPQHRRTLEWFLGTDGPVFGRTRLVVLDKEEFLVNAFVALVAARPGRGPAWLAQREPPIAEDERAARRLVDDVARVLGAEGRRAFLDGVNGVLRGKDTGAQVPPAERLEQIRARLGGTPAGAWLTAHREPIRALAAGQARDNPRRVIVDPLFWAITRTVDRWDGRNRPIRVVHDRQVSLTPARISALLAACAVPGRPAGTAGLVSLHAAESTADARIQVADFMAGIARRCLTAALDGAGNRPLVALVRPYLDVFYRRDGLPA